MKSSFWLVVLCLFLFFPFHLAQAYMPPFVDIGFFWTKFIKVLEGGTLYTDIYLYYPPLVFLFVPWLMKVLNTWSHMVFYGAGLSFTFVTMVLVYYIAKQCFNKKGLSILAMALYGIFSSGLFVQNNPCYLETFMTLPLCLAFIFLLKFLKSPKFSTCLWIGLFASSAFWVKHSAAIHIIGFWVILLISSKKRVRDTLFYAIGGLIPSLLLIAYFSSQNALPEFFQGVFVDALDYHSVTSIKTIIYNHVFVALDLLVPCFLLGVALIPFYEIRSRPALRACFIWLVFAYLGVSMKGVYFSYYFIQILPVLCVFAAYGLVKIYSNVKRSSFVVVCFLLFISIFYSGLVNTLYFFKYYPQSPYLRELDIANYIQQHSSSHDKVFVWEHGNMINALSQRASATRYSQVEGAVSKELFFNDIKRSLPISKPKFVVLTQDSYADTKIKNFPWLLDYIQNNYDLAKEFKVWPYGRRHMGFEFNVSKVYQRR